MIYELFCSVRCGLLSRAACCRSPFRADSTRCADYAANVLVHRGPKHLRTVRGSFQPQTEPRRARRTPRNGRARHGGSLWLLDVMAGGGIGTPRWSPNGGLRFGELLLVHRLGGACALLGACASSCPRRFPPVRDPLD